MFKWLNPKKKDEPKSEDGYLYSTEISLTHSDGSDTNIIIQGKNEKHISYVHQRISSLFESECIDEQPKESLEKDNQDFDIQYKKCWDAFEKIFEQLNKGRK